MLSARSNYSLAVLEETCPHYETILHHCHRSEAISEATPHHYDYISNKWCPSKITHDQADTEISTRSCNQFVIRHSSNNLILSKINEGRISHTIIQHSPKGYLLEGDSKFFDTIPDIIEHYKQSLGIAMEIIPSGIYNFNGIVCLSVNRVCMKQGRRQGGARGCSSTPKILAEVNRNNYSNF